LSPAADAPVVSRTRTRIERTPDGRRLVVSRTVRAPAEDAWDLLTDTERWAEWGPSVARVDSPVRQIETGTRGHVVVAGVGARVPFTVTACEPYRWTWDVARVPATGHTVTPRGPDRCRVAFEVPLAAAGYAVVCRRALTRIADLLERE
jgi:uncharacterized protein YndB with AHSA1/START domain